MWLALILACGGAVEPGPEPTPIPVEAAPVADPAATPAPARVDAPSIAEPVATPVPVGGPPAGYQACKEEWRAGGCTREHKDTCGIGGDGSTQTFANPCVACEHGVAGWKDGACP